MGIFLIMLGASISIVSLAMYQNAKTNLSDLDYVWHNYGDSDYATQQDIYRNAPWLIAVGIFLVIIGIIILIYKHKTNDNGLQKTQHNRHTLKCDKCGNWSSESEKYCNYCGNYLQTTQPNLSENYKICNECGSQVSAASKYCNMCGAETSSNLCSQCSSINPPTSKYCNNCGNKLR